MKTAQADDSPDGSELGRRDSGSSRVFVSRATLLCQSSIVPNMSKNSALTGSMMRSSGGSDSQHTSEAVRIVTSGKFLPHKSC